MAVWSRSSGLGSCSIWVSIELLLMLKRPDRLTTAKFKQIVWALWKRVYFKAVEKAVFAPNEETANP